jgi:iron-sulfur cluster assembly accessory protein
MTTIFLILFSAKSEGSDDLNLLGEVPCERVAADGFPVSLTDKAVATVKAALEETEGADGGVLRVGVRGGGCAGFEYSLNFTDELEDDDVATVTRGVKVVTDAFSAGYLEGTELDFVETLQGAGFKFINPNARRTCGCGSSFS